MDLQIVHYSSNYIFGTFKRYVRDEKPRGFNKIAAFPVFFVPPLIKGGTSNQFASCAIPFRITSN